MSLNPDVIQLAIFLREAPPFTALSLWSMLGEGDPAAFSTVAPGHTQVQGEIDGLNTSFAIQAQAQFPRIDMWLNELAVNTEGPTPFVDFDAAISQAQELASRFLNRVAVGRVASIIQGNDFAESLPHAVRLLKDMLPGIPLKDDVQETSFQITIPRHVSPLHQQQIVRIVKWQTITMDLLFQNVTITGQLAQTNVKKYAANLYIDVYFKDMNNLDTEEATSQVEKVLTIASDIMRNGYEAV